MQQWLTKIIFSLIKFGYVCQNVMCKYNFNNVYFYINVLHKYAKNYKTKTIILFSTHPNTGSIAFGVLLIITQIKTIQQVVFSNMHTYKDLLLSISAWASPRLMGIRNPDASSASRSLRSSSSVISCGVGSYKKCYNFIRG